MVTSFTYNIFLVLILIWRQLHLNMYDFVKFLVSSVKIAAVLHKFYSSLVVVVVKSPIRITGSNVRTVHGWSQSWCWNYSLKDPVVGLLLVSCVCVKKTLKWSKVDVDLHWTSGGTISNLATLQYNPYDSIFINFIFHSMLWRSAFWDDFFDLL